MFMSSTSYTSFIFRDKRKPKKSLSSAKNIVSKKKPFMCMHCTKSFTSKNGLFIHTRSHTGEKPYSCDQCPKRFVSASNLRDHRMIHWREKTHSKIKPFTCMHCTKLQVKTVYLFTPEAIPERNPMVVISARTGLPIEEPLDIIR